MEVLPILRKAGEVGMIVLALMLIWGILLCICMELGNIRKALNRRENMTQTRRGRR